MNNDRFKFRVWDKKHNCYHTSDNWFVDRDGQLWFKGAIFETGSDEDFTIEQCTGMKDKNGKLIYEGDIVKAVCGGMFQHGMEFEVIGGTHWEIRLLNSRKYRGYNIYNSLDVGIMFEIIGNIHNMEIEK